MKKWHSQLEELTHNNLHTNYHLIFELILDCVAHVLGVVYVLSV